MRFLLVIPCFRESDRLPRFLRELVDSLQDAPYSCNILVVDDGSGDREQKAVLDLVGAVDSVKQMILPPLLQPRNLGKGGAVRAGHWETF